MTFYLSPKRIGVCMSAPCENLKDSHPVSGYHPEISSRFPVFAPELAINNDGFDRALFETLFQIEPSHFWFKSRNELLIHCLKKYFPAAQNFCEIGCGTGYVLQAISSENPHMAVMDRKFIFLL